MSYEDYKENINELIEEISDVYKEDDWLIVKKYLLKYLNPKARKLFSTRNSKTKKHTLSDFDIKIINIYKEKTGIELKLNEKDRHKKNFNN